MGLVHPERLINRVTLHSLPITPEVRKKLTNYMRSPGEDFLESIVSEHSEVFECGQNSIVRYTVPQYQVSCIKAYFERQPKKGNLSEAIGQGIHVLAKFEYSVQSFRSFAGSIYENLKAPFIRYAFIDWLSRNLRAEM